MNVTKLVPMNKCIDMCIVKMAHAVVILQTENFIYKYITTVTSKETKKQDIGISDNTFFGTLQSLACFYLYLLAKIKCTPKSSSLCALNLLFHIYHTKV